VSQVDVRLTPATMDGGAWIACLQTRRAKAVFMADEMVVAGRLTQWFLHVAAQAHLFVD
jgi:hypothetical protein